MFDEITLTVYLDDLIYAIANSETTFTQNIITYILASMTDSDYKKFVKAFKYKYPLDYKKFIKGKE